MFAVIPASLDDWADIKILLDKVKMNAQFYEYYANAVDCIDFSPETIGGYLVNSLVNPNFKLFLIVKECDDTYRVKGFLTIAMQTQPCFKTGKMTNVALVPSVFCMDGISGELFSPAIHNFCRNRNIAYVYGNVKKEGAYSHFLNSFGAEEVSRTLLIDLRRFE